MTRATADAPPGLAAAYGSQLGVQQWPIGILHAAVRGTVERDVATRTDAFHYYRLTNR